MSLLPVYIQDDTGALLRQGELIDELSAALQKQAKELKAKLTKKVGDTFDTLQNLLKESRENAIAQVTKYANEFEQESNALVQKLVDMKYQPVWQANTELEAIIQREDAQAIAELKSCGAGWVFEMEEFKRKWKSLSRFKNWKYLLQPIAQEASCFAVANGKTQVFSLPSIQPLRVPTHLAALRGSLLCLPSTEWFLCETTMCHMIAPDFSSKRTICSLLDPRNEPALAYYHNCVYLFGGHTSKSASFTAECVDLDSRSTRILACPLPISFFGVVPCRCQDTLYFGCVLFYQGGYIFHLPTERFDQFEINFDRGGNSIAIFTINDEIVFLTNSGMYTYLFQLNECCKLTENSGLEYNCGTMPLRHQGSWYILGFNAKSQTKMILAMDEQNKDIRHMRNIEEPMDLLRQMLLDQELQLTRSKS
jgi:hypothetical protein